MQIVTDDGVELAAVVAGDDGDPGLILVHGWGGAKEDFADHIGALAETHRVVAFDHRAHGDSGRPDDPAGYTLERLARDVLCVADACGFARARLLGHSMGGMVARRLLVERPERVAAVVFMDTSPGPPPGFTVELARAAADLAREHGMSELKRVMDELDPLGTPAYRRLLAERPGYESFLAGKWERLAPLGYGELGVAVCRQVDDTEALRAVTVPALVLVGELDAPFLEPSRRLADALPGAQLVVVPDAGHSPQFENPDAWLAAVTGFLGALEPAGAM